MDSKKLIIPRTYYRPLQTDCSVSMLLKFGMHYLEIYKKLMTWMSLKNKSKLFYLIII